MARHRRSPSRLTCSVFGMVAGAFVAAVTSAFGAWSWQTLLAAVVAAAAPAFARRADRRSATHMVRAARQFASDVLAARAGVDARSAAEPVSEPRGLVAS